MRERRRAERGHFIALGSSQQRTRQATERYQRKMLIVGFVSVVAIVLLVLVAGFYFSSIRLPGKMVGKVGEQEITLRELVPLARAYAAEAGVAPSDLTAQDITNADILNILIRNEILSRQSPQLGVSVTDVDVQLELVRRFEAPFREAFAPTPTELGPDGRDLLDKFLDDRDLTESFYRSWIRGSLVQQATLNWFALAQPSEAEQRYVSWVVAATPEDAQLARDRLDQGDLFADVASDLNIDREFADQDGLVGWLPRGIVPEMDPEIFDVKNGSIIGPVATSLGGVVVLVDGVPETQPLAEGMASILSLRAAEVWYREQLVLLDIVHDLQADDVDWLVEQIG